jgi:hypothetical protein
MRHAAVVPAVAVPRRLNIVVWRACGHSTCGPLEGATVRPIRGARFDSEAKVRTRRTSLSWPNRVDTAQAPTPSSHLSVGGRRARRFRPRSTIVGTAEVRLDCAHEPAAGDSARRQDADGSFNREARDLARQPLLNGARADALCSKPPYASRSGLATRRKAARRSDVVNLSWWAFPMGVRPIARRSRRDSPLRGRAEPMGSLNGAIGERDGRESTRRQ